MSYHSGHLQLQSAFFWEQPFLEKQDEAQNGLFSCWDFFFFSLLCRVEGGEERNPISLEFFLLSPFSLNISVLHLFPISPPFNFSDTRIFWNCEYLALDYYYRSKNEGINHHRDVTKTSAVPYISVLSSQTLFMVSVQFTTYFMF